MKKLVVTVFAAVLILAGSAQAKEWNKIRIAVEGAFPPFSYTDQNGEVQGFDIDMANALCAEMKVECTLVKQDWDGMIPGLLARKYDAIVASMSITEERKRKVAFSNKYYNTPARFVAPKDSDLEVSEAGLKGKTIGVQRATTQDTFLTETYADIVNIKRYGTQDEAYLDLKAGRVDALLADAIAIDGGFLKTDAGQGYTFVGPELTDPRWFGEGAGIAVRKGDDELREMFNKAIQGIRDNGVYQKIQDAYFDFDVYGS